jgi:hypothetical protein
MTQIILTALKAEVSGGNPRRIYIETVGGRRYLFNKWRLEGADDENATVVVKQDIDGDVVLVPVKHIALVRLTTRGIQADMAMLVRWWFSD